MKLATGRPRLTVSAAGIQHPSSHTAVPLSPFFRSIYLHPFLQPPRPPHTHTHAHMSIAHVEQFNFQVGLFFVFLKTSAWFVQPPPKKKETDPRAFQIPSHSKKANNGILIRCCQSMMWMLGLGLGREKNKQPAIFVWHIVLTRAITSGSVCGLGLTLDPCDSGLASSSLEVMLCNMKQPTVVAVEPNRFFHDCTSKYFPSVYE